MDESLPELTLDVNQIEQVFINLFVNAADAIGEGGGNITIKSSLISMSPFGITPIKNAVCPKNHILMDDELKINGLPSIKVKAKFNGHEGFLNFDPIYGKHNNHYGIPFSENNLVDLFCPECEITLIDKNKQCPLCGSPVYVLNTTMQGVIEGCSKFGCYWEKWEAIDIKGEQQYIIVNVSDTGCGIKEDNLEKIFDPFYTTKGQKGTGLGLSVIWGIIDNHKGRITVKSKVAEGTNFKIRLPVSIE